MASHLLENALGYRFREPRLLVQALTHRSHSSPHNERLEFLGDSVLNCVMALTLYDRYPKLKEGELSRLRASLVRQEALHRVAEILQLGQHLALGEGELKSGGFRRPSILADALEAIFGAVLLDAGFEEVRALILRLFEPLLTEPAGGTPTKDPKTALQEYLQGKRLPLPLYQLRNTRGEAHAQEFEVECQVPDLKLAVVGTGPSRRAAEQDSAQKILDQLAKR